jgi:hypothetical protein
MPGKLKLDLDALRVDSFDTGVRRNAGTVGAYVTGAVEDTCWGGCVQYSGDPETCGGGGYEPTVLTCGGNSCPKSACAGMPGCGPTLNHTCLSCVGSQCGGITPCSPCTG